MYHVPVMLKETIDALLVHPDGVYVDLTFGGGGHSRAILERLGPNGRLYAFDKDPDALANVEKIKDERLIFIEADFRYVMKYLRLHGIRVVNGILADLGVSSHQLDEASRGFSIRFQGPLDMRMNTLAGESAADLLNELPEKELQNILGFYGEVINAKTLAAAIVRQRIIEPFKDTLQLVNLAKQYAPRNKDYKYLAQVFQALRIAVNDEIEGLKEMLLGATEMLATDGRLVIMSYHSLEDRLVKNLILKGNLEGEDKKDFYGNPQVVYKPLFRKPIEASEQELAVNPRSRSAKLRVGVKL